MAAKRPTGPKRPRTPRRTKLKAAAAKSGGEIRNRIIGVHKMLGKDLCPHPDNPRTHPDSQAEALRESLERFGIIGGLVAYRDPKAPKRLTLIDGHKRTKDFDATEWTVLETDLSREEAREALLYFDPITEIAGYDPAKLEALRADVEVKTAALRERIEARLAEARAAAIDSLLEHQDVDLGSGDFVDLVRGYHFAVQPEDAPTVDAALAAMTTDGELPSGGEERSAAFVSLCRKEGPRQ